MGGLLHLFHLDNQSMARKLVMHNKHVDGKFFIFHFFFIFFFCDSTIICIVVTGHKFG